MAYTPTYYPALTHTSVQNGNATGVWSWVRWLLNDKTTVSTTAVAPDAASVVGPAGPGWKLVACRSNGSVYSAQATGTITTDAPGNLADNQTFTLVDGVSPDLVFEFNVSGTATITPGYVEVDISAAVGADGVRDTIITVINSVKSLNTIQASDGGAATVDLKNVVPGTASNTTQSTTGGGAFAITDMTGGLQADGDGVLAAVTGATNWRDGTLADEDWCVLQSVRRTALGYTQQGDGLLKPLTGATAMVWTINGIALTGVLGPRTSGSDDYDMGLVNPTLIAAEMAAAINDPANSFKAHVNARIDAGISVEFVVVTADYLAHPGILGNLIDISVTATGVAPKVSSGASGTVDNATLSGGLTTNEFELFVRADTSAQELETILIPMTTENGAFVLPSTDVNTPALPATAFGEAFGVTAVCPTPDPTKWVQVADEGSVTGFFDQGDFGASHHHYIGSIQNQFAAVTKPFVMKGTGFSTVNWNLNQSQFDSTARPWRMLNPADETTLIEGCGVAQFWSTVFTHELTTTIDIRLGSRSIFPIGVWFMQFPGEVNLPARLMGGYLQNTWGVSNRSGGRGTMGTRAYAWLTDSLYTSDRIPIVIKWDGLTRY